MNSVAISTPSTAELSDAVNGKLNAMIASLRGEDGLAVSYSGGVDSTVMLWAARQAQPDRTVGILVDSASLARRDRALAETVAREIGAEFVTVEGGEQEDPRYRENTRERCYFCKFHGYGGVAQEARRRGLARVLDGTNADDTGDWRPGRRAAGEIGVESPLLRFGFTKSDVRETARFAGLTNWEKPASPCLASRIPHGVPVERESLARIEKAEDALLALGFRDLRVRLLGGAASVELPHEDWPAYLRVRDRVNQEFLALGFSGVELCPDGLKSGRLSRVP